MKTSVCASALLCVILVQCVATGGTRISGIELPHRRHGNPQEVPSQNRPLIGILSQPGDGMGYSLTSTGGLEKPVPPGYSTSYIAASYVKFVEMGGARAVPLIWNEPEETLRKKFSAINGILFPGGGTSLKDSPFFRVADKLFNWAIEANDRGDHFPIYGVCLGFELLSVIVSKNHDILEPFHAENNPGPLLFVGDSAKHEGMFKWIPLNIIDELYEQKLTMQNHKWGLSPEKWISTPELNDFFQILTVTPDLNEKLYVSTVEAREYPILGVQWHPEKNAFEWGIDNIPHSADAIRITQSVANFLIAEARKSTHTPSSFKEEQDFLIYNHAPVYTGKEGKGTFDQAYVFN
ncbi:gamma-glutamyl hydrolase 1 [Physcomitrium patens]|uniref:folate gamma-glutamyl hydrolase n=1 Tax=Physcomitrium patens TaxID=3218 RepID=A0A2K1J3J7_PHYPA|nr:gamma-glutamyl hydrolase 1-like [Physcomitrium patens]XP_024399814.1 gamma-glutamyl hydrolase 1-like [Physcomitrium patens]PNR36107.1 hypothetical protein PHYPA_021957 [Physcomitrium patens]|eukprot:XP_024399813.1 gamma-glutamyl hydrolase 1-like [Physcomitrella patens]